MASDCDSFFKCSCNSFLRNKLVPDQVILYQISCFYIASPEINASSDHVLLRDGVVKQFCYRANLHITKIHVTLFSSELYLQHLNYSTFCLSNLGNLCPKLVVISIALLTYSNQTKIKHLFVLKPFKVSFRQLESESQFCFKLFLKDGSSLEFNRKTIKFKYFHNKLSCWIFPLQKKYVILMMLYLCAQNIRSIFVSGKSSEVIEGGLNAILPNKILKLDIVIIDKHRNKVF